jgi:hypothetical protein
MEGISTLDLTEIAIVIFAVALVIMAIVGIITSILYEKRVGFNWDVGHPVEVKKIDFNR